MSDSYTQSETNIHTSTPVPDGKYTAIITDVKIKNNVRNYIVEFCYAYCNEGTLQNGRYQFNHVFTNKRGHFQEFCEGLGLFDEQTHQLDLSKALGTYCIVDFNTQDYELTIRPALERDMRRERNLSILNSASIADTIEDIPEMIQNYYYFLSYPKKEIPYVTHFGCITGYDFFPDKDNPDDETLRLDVAIFNGGYPKHFQYYLNRINTDGHDNFIEFCENFDITDKKNNIYLDDVLFIPCSVKLYPARSGKVYVSEAVPLSVENKYHQKQLYLMCYAYHNYLNSNLYDMFAFDEL